MGFLYTLLFLLFLSVLITVHELGHLTAAKIFKVYCHEFSIGFGPALVHKKKVNGETYFSLRCIPFGGYVAMYGEPDVKIPGAEDVDPSRSLAMQKKWKQAIIMVAGVTMNAVLALFMFFISEACCPQSTLSINYINYDNNSIVLNSGIDVNKPIYLRGVSDADNYSTYYAYFDGVRPKDVADIPDAYITLNDGSTREVAMCVNQSSFNLSNTSFTSSITVFERYERERTVKGVKSVWLYPDVSKKVDVSKIKSITFHLSNCEYDISSGLLDAKDETRVFCPNPITVEIVDGKLPNLGMNVYKNTYWNDFKPGQDKNGFKDDHNPIRKTFVDFGNSATVIFKGIGSLFTRDGWKNVGGLIAIGVSTSQTLANFGIGKFLFIWGMISVNLAVVNLLPFPALDGWQLLVITIEGITRKKLPDKFKKIASAIGLGLLFVLMILVIIKDIITLV